MNLDPSYYLHYKKSNNENINSVVNEYLNLFNRGQDNNIRALIRANIRKLNKESDMNDVILQIENCTGKDPLSPCSNDIKKIGLVSFFNKIDIKTYKNPGVNEIINQLKK